MVMDFVGVWFGTAVVIAMASRVVLSVRLVKRGVPFVSVFWASMPGALESLYADWCHGNGKSPRKLLVFHRVLYVNMFVAAFAFVGYAGGTSNSRSEKTSKRHELHAPEVRAMDAGVGDSAPAPNGGKAGVTLYDAGW